MYPESVQAETMNGHVDFEKRLNDENMPYEEPDAYNSNDEMLPVSRIRTISRSTAPWFHALHAATLLLLCVASLSIIISSAVYYHSGLSPPKHMSCDCRSFAKDNGNNGHPFPLNDMPLASELNGLVPPFKQEIVTFWNNSDYVPVQRIMDAEPLSDVVAYITEAWGTLMPPHQAFISVPEPDQYILPLQLEDNQGNKTDLFGVSVFHQLHCLFLLLRSWTAFHYGGDQFNKPEHLLHCFDFIRIQLMCVGDTALEGADAVSILQGKRTGTIGLGSRHICRDWDALFEWTVEHESTAAESPFHHHNHYHEE